MGPKMHTRSSSSVAAAQSGHWPHFSSISQKKHYCIQIHHKRPNLPLKRPHQRPYIILCHSSDKRVSFQFNYFKHFQTHTCPRHSLQLPRSHHTHMQSTYTSTQLCRCTAVHFKHLVLGISSGIFPLLGQGERDLPVLAERPSPAGRGRLSFPSTQHC